MQICPIATQPCCGTPPPPPPPPAPIQSKTAKCQTNCTPNHNPIQTPIRTVADERTNGINGAKATGDQTKPQIQPALGDSTAVTIAATDAAQATEPQPATDGAGAKKPPKCRDNTSGLSDEPGDANTGGNSIYVSVDPVTGEIQYVGRTNDLARRAGEHLREKEMVIQGVPGLGSLSLYDAVGVEQVLIEEFGGPRTNANPNATLRNKRNSMAKSNPAYDATTARGREILGNC